MNEYLKDISTYIVVHKAKFITGAAVTLGAILVLMLIALFMYNNQPKVVYQPATACNLLTLSEAQELMGPRTLRSNNAAPAVYKNTAVSKCGYTDGNPGQQDMVVAALIVRSGVNDEGVEQNKKEFTAGWPTKNVETVSSIGDKAYFNTERGQLNVLKGRDWFIFSYGIGTSPQTNSVEKVTELARKVIR